MGLVSALVLAQGTPQIYTDHLNSTILIQDSLTAVNLDGWLQSMNGQYYYCWILDLVNRKSATLTYTKAHTNDTILPAVLNREADHLASTSQKHISSIPIASIPTFFMDPYMFHCEPDGWVESNIQYFIDHFIAKSTSDTLALMPKHRMSTWLYDPNTTWLYTKALSAYTALIQLYARSGKLPTAEGIFNKKASVSSALAALTLRLPIIYLLSIKDSLNCAIKSWSHSLPQSERDSMMPTYNHPIRPLSLN